MGDLPPFLNPRFQLGEDSRWFPGNSQISLQFQLLTRGGEGGGIGEERSWDRWEAINRYLPSTKRCQAGIRCCEGEGEAGRARISPKGPAHPRSPAHPPAEFFSALGFAASQAKKSPQFLGATAKPL